MRLIVIILLALAFAGCKKKTDVFVFDCVVYDQRINAPVEGANITMRVQRAAGGFNPNYETVGLAASGANGRFYIEVDKEAFFSYRLEVSHSQHFVGVFDINPDDVPFSTAYSATFNLEPKAWIATHIVNQNFSQTVTFSINAETDVCSNCCSSNNTILQGFPMDTTFLCQVFGAQQVQATGNFVDQNGGVHQITETVFAEAFDTTTINIIY